MKVLIVTGIWPPDVGGPASHAPELAEHLVSSGHEVAVVTTADGPPEPERYRVDWVSRGMPVAARQLAVVERVRARSAEADVVYATTMINRATLGSTLARKPLVIKLTTDPAYERARRWGMFDGDMDAFQGVDGDVRVGALRRARDFAVGRASRVICPSAYLRDMALGWGLPRERTLVVPNPAPDLPPLPAREEARAALDIDGPTLAFAGRISRQKSLGVGIDAVSRVAGVRLLVAGDGPEREEMERLASERVRFLGPLPRDDVLRLFRAADASLLSSTWENFPHTVVESLAVGTPVIATAVGGVPEVVKDGENGLLVAPGDADALAAAIERFFGEPGLRERLHAASVRSVAGHGSAEMLARIEAVLMEAAR